MSEDASRAEFEAFISGPPFECDVERFPDDPDRFAWPGTYRSLPVDLAWQCWQEARKKKPPGGPGGIAG